MDINLTLFGELITFMILVYVTLKFIWPPITKAMQDRQKKIADGLEAGERGRNKLKQAEKQTAEMVKESKIKSEKIIEGANARASQIVDDAKERGQQEGQRMIENAKSTIMQETQSAKEGLRKELANLVIAATAKVIEKEMDQTTHHQLVDEIISKV